MQLKNRGFMGLSLEFLLGNVESILRAYAEDNFALLAGPGAVDDHADLSLHVDPQDLDRLSVCMARYSGLPAISLRPHLTMQVDEPGQGALTVSPDWIQYAAAVPAEHSRSLVEDWYAKMAQDWNEPEIVVNESAVEAVAKFLELCRRAQSEGRVLVHTWSG